MRKYTWRHLLLPLTCLLFVTSCQPAQTAPPASDQAVEIVFWHALGKKAVAVLDETIDNFNDSQGEYRVTTVLQGDYSETYQRLQTAIAGGNAPDLALLDVDKTYILDQKNLLEHFDELIAADGDFQQGDYLDIFFSQGVNADGKVFALPAFGATQVMYYDRDAFAKAGIQAEELSTWEHLGDAARVLSVREGGKTLRYGWKPMWKSPNLVDAALSNGGKLLSEDGRTVLINEPEWVESWETFRRWIHEEKIMGVNFGGQGWEYWYRTIDEVMAGRAAGYTGSSGDQVDLDFHRLGAFQQPGWEGKPPRPVAKALHLAVPSSADETRLQGAYRFACYFTSPDQQAHWSISTGYILVRESAMELDSFQEYAAQHPQVMVPIRQSLHASPPPIDPTGNQIYDALEIACDQVEIDNIPAQEALDYAYAVAQKALDRYWAKKNPV